MDKKINLTLTDEGLVDIQNIHVEKITDFVGLVEENLDDFDNFDVVKEWDYDGWDVVVTLL